MFVPPINQSNTFKRQTRSTTTVLHPCIPLKRIDAKNTQLPDALSIAKVTNEPVKTKTLLKECSEQQIIEKNVASPQLSPKIEKITSNTNSPVDFDQGGPAAAKQTDQKLGSTNDANLLPSENMKIDRPADFVQSSPAAAKQTDDDAFLIPTKKIKIEPEIENEDMYQANPSKMKKLRKNPFATLKSPLVIYENYFDLSMKNIQI